MIWKTPVDLHTINTWSKNTLAGLLGIVFTHVDDNSLTAIMPIDQKLMQPMGSMHGGASCVLAETVGSVAANFCVDQSIKMCVGLEINVNHLRPVLLGHLSVVTAIASLLHLGKTTQVWDIKIRDEQKKLVAISRLTVAVIDQKK